MLASVEAYHVTIIREARSSSFAADVSGAVSASLAALNSSFKSILLAQMTAAYATGLSANKCLSCAGLCAVCDAPKKLLEQVRVWLTQNINVIR